MHDYLAKLYVTPNNKYTTEGCLDSSILNGVSLQRTLNMISTPDEIVVNVKDGSGFSTSAALTVTPGFIAD
jgi:hypothetical protein